MGENIGNDEINMQKPSLFGMITSPSVQFERMKEKAPIGLPLVVMILLLAVIGALVSYLSLNNPLMKELDVEIPVAFTVGMGVVSGIFGGVATFFIAAGFYKLIMVFMKNDTPYMKLVAVVIYSSIITALGTLINAVIAFALGGYEVTYTSLAPLFSDSAILKAIATNFEIFRIWYYVVLALGLQIVAGISKKSAIMLVVFLFLISVVFSAVSGSLQQFTL